MNLPSGLCFPLGSNGVTKSLKRRRGLAEKLLYVPPNWLPVKAGIEMPWPSFDNPLLAPVTYEIKVKGKAHKVTVAPA